MFVTQEDLSKPEVVSSLAEEGEEEYGVILPNGEINWDCPCLGGMPHGPCGQEFKDAFSCFHYRCEGWEILLVHNSLKYIQCTCTCIMYKSIVH